MNQLMHFPEEALHLGEQLWVAVVGAELKRIWIAECGWRRRYGHAEAKAVENRNGKR